MASPAEARAIKTISLTCAGLHQTNPVTSGAVLRGIRCVARGCSVAQHSACRIMRRADVGRRLGRGSSSGIKQLPHLRTRPCAVEKPRGISAYWYYMQTVPRRRVAFSVYVYYLLHHHNPLSTPEVLPLSLLTLLLIGSAKPKNPTRRANGEEISKDFI